MPGYFYGNPEESIAFDSREERSQYFEPMQSCDWCGGDHYWAACSVIRSTGPINSSVFTSLEQAGYEHQDSHTNKCNWGNFPEPSYSYNNIYTPPQKSSLEVMMERLKASTKEIQREVREFQNENRAENMTEANTMELAQDKSEEQVFEDSSDEEVEYYWHQISKDTWRRARRNEKMGNPFVLHTTEEETTVENYCEKTEDSRVTWMAGQPSNGQPAVPEGSYEGKLKSSDSTEKMDEPEPIYLEIPVLKPRVPFARKRLDLSVYTFEEPKDEHNVDEARDIWTTADACEGEYKDGEEFVNQKTRKHRRKLKRVKSKEERSHSKQTRKLSSSKRPLKQTHWNSGKRSRGRNRGKCFST